MKKGIVHCFLFLYSEEKDTTISGIFQLGSFEAIMNHILSVIHLYLIIVTTKTFFIY